MARKPKPTKPPYSGYFLAFEPARTRKIAESLYHPGEASESFSAMDWEFERREIALLGDDVQRKELRLYIAFKRLKNFATLVPQRGRLLLYLHLDAAEVTKVLPVAKDVSQKGHWGTGDVEIPLSTLTDLEAAKPFIAAAYEGRSQTSKPSVARLRFSALPERA